MKLTPELKELSIQLAATIPFDKRFSIEQICWEFAERFLAALPNSEQDYEAQLAESQARESKLREIEPAMQRLSQTYVKHWIKDCDSLQEGYLCGNVPVRPLGKVLRCVTDLIATPFDATALNELIAKAGEVMRERTAKNTRDTMFRIGQTSPYRKMVSELLDAIRALPSITLEDLK